LNNRLRRHAEEQYLLHWHSHLLLFSSLGMIAGSCGVMIVSIQLSLANFLPTLILVLAISAAIYTALVHRSKKRIRAAQSAHGMLHDQMMEIVSDSRQLTLVTPSGTYHWPNEQLKVHLARKGLLVCPEPFLFVFVPKRADFQFHTYGEFVGLLKSRAVADAKNVG
jgi:hypothetical protein